MIKKYSELIIEENSIGSWIESVSKDDEYLLSIISHYTKDIDPKIRIANAINTLNEDQKKELLNKVKSHLSNEIESQDIDITTHVDINVNESLDMGGKNIFKSFLKIISALGIRKTAVEWDIVPEEYLIYYKWDNINCEKLRSIIQRFRSVTNFMYNIEEDASECSVYYGIKTDLTFDYGFITSKKIVIGQFRLTSGNFKWMLLLDSPSISSLKKEVVDMDIKNISLYCKIKNDMLKFIPGESEKKSVPKVENDIMIFGYYGIGNWVNGQLDDNSYNDIKTKVKQWIMKFKWRDSVMVSVSSKSFWTKIALKIK